MFGRSDASTGGATVALTAGSTHPLSLGATGAAAPAWSGADEGTRGTATRVACAGTVGAIARDVATCPPGDTQNCQPGGGAGQDGSGCQPGGGVHPTGGAGHPAGT